MEQLLGIKRILDRYKALVLNVRVGATDFSSCFGARRDVEYTIYDIMTVSDILLDILNIFTRRGDYVVSGPVWEYFKINKSLRFQELPKVNLQESLLRREPLVGAEVDGLLRELIIDKANGFIGKTIIHPTHINYVNGFLTVTREEYEDALQVLNTSGGVQLLRRLLYRHRSDRARPPHLAIHGGGRRRLAQDLRRGRLCGRRVASFRWHFQSGDQRGTQSCRLHMEESWKRKLRPHTEE